MRWNELDSEVCSMARTLSVIGDRWTLLILRDCFLRVRRFDEFQARLGIGRPLLADRLQKLVDNFVLVKVPYREKPRRYEYRLTDKGLGLFPIMMSLLHWGDTYMVTKKGRPILHRHTLCGCTFDPALVCSECGKLLEPREVETLPGPGLPRAAHVRLTDPEARSSDKPPPRPRRRRFTPSRVTADP